MREQDVVKLLKGAQAIHRDIPKQYSPAIEKATDSDRAFFKEHPKKTVRLRRPVIGEFGPLVDYSAIAFVRVDKVNDDTRMRSCIPWV